MNISLEKIAEIIDASLDGDPSKDVGLLGKKELIKYVILDGKEVDLTPAPERIKDPDGWRISSYSGKILKK